jgi:valyl-tRNA synthetase
MIEKHAKQAAKIVKEVVTGEKKEKVKPVKEKKEEEVPYIDNTPKGHKKGMYVDFEKHSISTNGVKT